MKLPLDGIDLGNMFTVRGVKDAEAINAAVGEAEKDEDKKNVVVVGSSFIGMEVALALASKAKVTVVGMDKVPFEKILGEPIGAGIRKFHEGKGTKFFLPAELSHFEPKQDDAKVVGSVHLKDGTSIPADVVVLGTGVKPSTELLKKAGLQLEKNGTVKTNAFLEIEQLKGKGKGRVFALGDIATHDTPKGPNYVQVSLVESPRSDIPSFARRLTDSWFLYSTGTPHEAASFEHLDTHADLLLLSPRFGATPQECCRCTFRLHLTCLVFGRLELLILIAVLIFFRAEPRSRDRPHDRDESAQAV